MLFLIIISIIIIQVLIKKYTAPYFNLNHKVDYKYIYTSQANNE